jgi:RNA polymerase sigma factor (sigma-70 family)
MRDSLTRLFLRFRDRHDGRALAKLFDRLAPELLGVAVHLIDDPWTAEDLVQTTFLVAIEHPERFDAERSVRPWLFGILIRQAARAHRRIARTPDPSLLAGREAEDPAVRASRAELPAAVLTALERCRPGEREVLGPYLLEGRKLSEIAASLGRSPGTVRMQLHRGLERLRRGLPAGFAVGVLAQFSNRGLAATRGRVLKAAGVSPSVLTSAGLGGLLATNKVIVIGVVLAAACTLPAVLHQPSTVDRVPASAEGSTRPVSEASSSGNGMNQPPLDRMRVSQGDPGNHSEFSSKQPAVSTENDGARMALQKVDECLKGFDPDEVHSTLECLMALDLGSIDSESLANWLCETPASRHEVQLVGNVRVSQLRPAEVFRYIREVQDTCDKYQETGLTVSSIGFGRLRSETWYRELLGTLDQSSLLPENGSDAVIQAAEYFVQEGELRAIKLLEDIGRGVLGGSSDQMYRAAVISIVHMEWAQSKLDYLMSISGQREGSNDRAGNLFGHYLPNGSCFVRGDPKPALRALLDVLHDPRFAKSCAYQMREFVGRDAPQGDGGLWQQVLETAESIRQYGS